MFVRITRSGCKAKNNKNEPRHTVEEVRHRESAAGFQSQSVDCLTHSLGWSLVWHPSHNRSPAHRACSPTKNNLELCRQLIIQIPSNPHPRQCNSGTKTNHNQAKVISVHEQKNGTKNEMKANSLEKCQIFVNQSSNHSLFQINPQKTNAKESKLWKKELLRRDLNN